MRLAVARLAAVAAVAAGCSSPEVTVEGVQREVQLDEDGRVVDSSAVAPSEPREVRPEPTTTTTTVEATLRRSEATDGTAAVDCGGGATRERLTEGRSSGAGGETVELIGEPLLDDLDGDGLVDLAAAYTCSSEGRPQAMSLSLWRGRPEGPRRSAVSVAPPEAGWSVVLPDAPGDGRVGVSVLAPAGVRPAITTTTAAVFEAAPLPAPNLPASLAPAPTPDTGGDSVPQPVRLNPNQLPPDMAVVRQIVGVIDNGRIRVVADAPPPASSGVDSLPIEAFPERLELDGAGLGPLRIGATEAQLTEALALVVSRVEFPPPPPCFGSANRVLAVGPVYFGLRNDVLETVWVTESQLATSQRRIPLALSAAILTTGIGGASAGTSSGPPPPGTLTVEVGINPEAPPSGLSVAGFGDGWVALQPARSGAGVSVAVEGPTAGSEPDRISGFGIAPRTCLRADFEPETAVAEATSTTDPPG